MKPRPTLEAFDAYLAGRGLAFEGIAIGGAALSLMGVIDRETRDRDVLDPEIPGPVQAAVAAFARDRSAGGDPLQEDWLNNGPASLVPQLPAGWRARTASVFEGTALRLRGLGRPDLLLTKLFAFCDRGTDVTDCVVRALSPGTLASRTGRGAPVGPGAGRQPGLADPRRLVVRPPRPETRP